MATRTHKAMPAGVVAKKRRIESWSPWLGPMTPAMAQKHGSRVPDHYETVWFNDQFVVCVVTTRQDALLGEVKHVLFQTASGSKDVKFYDYLRIKNELFGEERYALQVVPAQSELVDRSNSYHMHILSEEMSERFKDEGILPIRYMKEV